MVDRPSKRLVGFKRVAIPAAQTRVVEFSLKAETLAYWSVDKHQFLVEKDKVTLFYR
jgi:hypothetical protein